MTDKLLTDNAVSAQAITLAQADELETFIESWDWDGEDDMPPNIKKIYDIALRHYHNGRMH